MSEGGRTVDLPALTANLGVAFEHIPVVLLVVDRERRVLAMNAAARSTIVGPSSFVDETRAGDVLRCVNRRAAPEGCGSGPLCGGCSLRHAVRETIEIAAAQGPFDVALPSDSSPDRILRISTSPLAQDEIRLALVAAEDVTELRAAGQMSIDVAANVPSGLFVYQFTAPDSLRFVSANPAAARLTGANPEALVGREFDEIWPEARARKLTDALLEVMRTGEAFEADAFDYSDARVAGSFLIRAFRLPGDRLAVAFEDVTGRQRTSEALAESEAMLRALVESTDSMIVFLDTEQRLCLFNSTYSKHMRTAHGVEVFPGVDVRECYAGEERAFWDHSNRRALAGERMRTTHLERCAGEERSFGSSIHPILRERRVIGVSHFTRDITERVRAEERLHELTRRLVVVQEEERRRLSRELHDEVGQVLTAVKMGLQRLQRSQRRGALWDRLQENVGHVDQAIADIRRLCLALRPPLLDEVGLGSALTALAERIGRDGGVDVLVDVAALPARIPPELEIGIFRVAQEALTNVLRHAGARHAWLRAGTEDDGLVVAIRDDGRGFAAAEGGKARVEHASMGLTSMRERIELLGGRLRIESRPGSGTEVAAWIPFSTRESKEGGA